MFSLSLTEGTKHLEAILGKSACKYKYEMKKILKSMTNERFVYRFVNVMLFRTTNGSCFVGRSVNLCYLFHEAKLLFIKPVGVSKRGF